MRPRARSCRVRCPRCSVEDRAAGALVMAYLSRAGTGCGRSCAPARRIGPWPRRWRRLGRIHAATARRARRRGGVPDRRDLPRHPARALSAGHGRRASRSLRHALRRVADAPPRPSCALVHGDVSPKNILVGPDGPVFLDAECAWYGDPGVRPRLLPQPPAAQMPVDAGGGAGLPRLLRQRWRQPISAGVAWEPRDALEARTAALLPGLLLARVDGKSPVEYVDRRADKERVRRVAGAFLLAPPDRHSPRCERGLGRGAGGCEPDRDRAVTAGGSGTAAAGRRSRPRSARRRRGRPGDRARRRVDRQRARRSTCATAARPSAASTSTARGGQHNGEIVAGAGSGRRGRPGRGRPRA